MKKILIPALFVSIFSSAYADFSVTIPSKQQVVVPFVSFGIPLDANLHEIDCMIHKTNSDTLSFYAASNTTSIPMVFLLNGQDITNQYGNSTYKVNIPYSSSNNSYSFIIKNVIAIQNPDGSSNSAFTFENSPNSANQNYPDVVIDQCSVK